MSLSKDDLLYRWLQASLPVSMQSENTAVTPGSISGSGYMGETVFAYGAETTPSAASAFATSDPLTGLYQINAQVVYTGTGTPAEAEAANIAVYVGVFRKMSIMIPPVKNTIATIDNLVFRFANQPVQLASIGAGTTDVTYRGTICAVKIGD